MCTDRFGDGIVMVRAGICHDGRTQLKIVQRTLNAIKYRDDILDPTVLFFLQQRNLYINNRIGQQVIPTYMKSSPYKVYTLINDSKTKH